jgi:hypothetical protein
LVEPDTNEADWQSGDVETLAKIIHKMDKNFGRNDMMKCIPVMWHMICKFKSRVETVFFSLTNGLVAHERKLGIAALGGRLDRNA